MDHIIKYRKDIDGLRALSVLIVILFHCGLPGFSGGFIGVDIFFVISGYLISSIILKELNEDKFSFFKFYERRVRRILPILFFVIFVTTIFGYFFFDFKLFKDFGQSIIATSLYCSNFYFYHNANDYFAAPNNPLLHTWSLGVEEQFYIFFPVCLLLLYKYQKRYVNYYLVAAALLSFAFCVVMVKHNQPLAFYSPVARAWQLLAGVLLSVNLYPAIKSKILNNIVAVLGLGLILIGLFTFSSATTYPAYNALLPIVGAVLLICTGKHESTIISKLFSLKPVAFIGQISYSMYLWHWVILIGLKTIIVGPLSAAEIIALIVLTFGLSYLSWRFIEQPFRKKQLLVNRNKLFLATAIVSVVIIGFGYYVRKTNGMYKRSTQSKMMVDFAKREKSWQALVRFDKATVKLAKTGRLLKIGADNVEPQYLLWGDSHAKALADGFDAAAKAKNVSMYFATGPGTPPLIGALRFNHQPNGAVIADNVIKFLQAHPEVKTVVLAGRWSLYDTNNDHSVIMQNDSTKKAHVFDNKKVFNEGLIATVKAIKALNRKVFIITDVPEMEAGPSVYVNERNIFHRGTQLNALAPTEDSYYKQNKDALDLFSTLQKDTLAEVLPAHEKFFANNKCLIQENGHLLYRDEHHLSYYGSLKLKDYLSAEIFK